ncbi:MAG: CHAD domain-containing protein [Hoeflea sp.]|uniref:CHAD domain-containing protein n=1 Tax=Hoeflea sp. TaxID=1940281 RepID=UPI00272F91D7|nr:CHAD domain-containing protein [Hoeflea sp.]MDP2120085.1 CHAD domain-containing protein [Hoeflea sp.]
MTYRIRPGEKLGPEVVRVAQLQYEGAIGLLRDQPDGRDQAIHDARKRFKRLRGLFRLIRAASPDFYVAENARVRDIAAKLSAERDATALVETLDHLLEGTIDPEEHVALRAIRDRLAARRDRITREQTDLEARIEAAIGGCEDGIRALSTLRLPKSQSKATALLADGTARNYGRAVTALQTAIASGDPADWHDLRKRIKYHRMHVQLMSAAWPGEMGLRAKVADIAGEALGDDHDLENLEALIAAEPEEVGTDDEIALLRSLMAARSAALHDQIRALVKNLLRDDRKVVRKRIVALWRDAAG